MAMFKDVIYLITETFVMDEYLQQIPQTTEREVFANVKSVSSKEFFDAGHTDLKPDKQFLIRLSEYNDEQLLRYENKTYSIYRTYEKGENIELYCEVRVSGN